MNKERDTKTAEGIITVVTVGVKGISSDILLMEMPIYLTLVRILTLAQALTRTG